MSLLAPAGAALARPLAYDATPAAASSTAAKAIITPASAIAQLRQLRGQVDSLKQQVTSQSTDNDLSDLYDQTNQVGDQAQALLTAITAASSQAQSAVDLLGAPPPPTAPPEPPAVASHRAALGKAASTLNDQVSQAQTLQASIADLSRRIANQRRRVMMSTLARPSSSILAPSFWAPLFQPNPPDQQRLRQLIGQLKQTAHSSWRPETRIGSGVLVVLALAVYFLGLRLLQRGLTFACMRWLPGGRLRRSALAMATALSIVLAISLAAQLLYLEFMRGTPIDPDVQTFAQTIRGTAIACALILGLGRALLSSQRPSWRLPPIADPIARALAPFPAIVAVSLMVFGSLEQINATAGTSLVVTVFGNGLVAVVITSALLIGMIRVYRTRRHMAPNTDDEKQASTWLPIVRAFTYIVVSLIVGTLLLGYISLARFLVYELIWCFMVLTVAYLLDRLATDICTTWLSQVQDRGDGHDPASHHDRWRAPLGTIITATIHVVVLVLTLLALFGGHFDNDPGTLIHNAINAVGGNTLSKFNIMPVQIFDAVLALVIGTYILRACRRWLEDDLLPKTRIDAGVGASLVMLLTNVGYVLIALATLNALGVKWNQLAWIVSALSVGIGFGLQEIVKNFISGLILLTERPIRVGDQIDLSGVVGDVQRINVRATEIKLSDRSTVIVPNSQFISQNVRNVTMGHAQGVVTIAMTYPLDNDPARLRELLLACYHDEPSILETPAPSVTFTELNANGMTLSVTGYVASPRQISAIKSALLFEILARLRADSIVLSSPQSMVIQNLPTRPPRQDPAVVAAPATEPGAGPDRSGS